MSDPVLVALIVAVQGIGVAAMNAWIAAKGRAVAKQLHEATTVAVATVSQKIEEAHKDISAVTQKVEDTHKDINGRMTELLAAAKAQGAQDQRDEMRQDSVRAEAEKDRQAGIVPPDLMA